jgi:Flp pilus assembly protein TadD
MKRAVVFVCVLAVAAPAFAQDDEYQRLIAQGSALEQAGNYNEAVAVFRQALQLAESFKDGRLPNTLNMLAAVYDGAGQPLQAEKHYQRALAILESTN